MIVDPLCWQVEQACRSAWPDSQSVVVGPWLIRYADAITRRTNSVNPLPALAHDVAQVMEEAAGFYRAKRQDLIFRIPSFLPHIPLALEGEGFVPEAPTVTLFKHLGADQGVGDSRAALESQASRTWLRARQHCSASTDEQAAAFDQTLSRIQVPTAFAGLDEDSRTVALGYGALDGCMLVVESVITDPAHRRRGLAARVVQSLMRWAVRQGATDACLQVECANGPALALYKSLGFDSRLFTYTYYRRP